MLIKDNTRLNVTEHILSLERGSDQLLLANYLDLRPLYIRQGRTYIKNFLQASSELGTYKKIIGAFPGEKDLLNMLLEHGILVPDPPGNNALQPHREELNLDNKMSMSLYLLISQSCNMGCIYCLNGRTSYQTDKALLMKKEVAFRSVERCLDSISPQGRLEIVFFGGEPLLNWPLARETIKYCEDSLKPKHIGKQIKYHFTSNLSLLPADLIEWALKFNITFLCDIDGPEHIHNRCRPFKNGNPSLEIIARNINHLSVAGLTVFLRTTVTSLNHDHLLEIAGYHKTIGGKSSAFIPVNPLNSDEDILDESLLPSVDMMIGGMTEIYSSKIWSEAELYPFNTYGSRLVSGARTVTGCGAPYGNTPVVAANGDVYPCIYLVGLKRYYMGNIMNGSYPDRNVLQWMYDYLHVDNREDCKSCPWRYICSGACPVGRLMVLNNPSATREVKNYCKRISCEYTRKIFELILWEKAQAEASSFLENYKKSDKISDTVFC